MGNYSITVKKKKEWYLESQGESERQVAQDILINNPPFNDCQEITIKEKDGIGYPFRFIKGDGELVETIPCEVIHYYDGGFSIKVRGDYNTKTGEVIYPTLDEDGGGLTLNSQKVILFDENETELTLCAGCNEYVLRPKMKDVDGTNLEEVLACPNEHCQTNQE